jgi:probable F420-dependent oxidoreductase
VKIDLPLAVPDGALAPVPALAAAAEAAGADSISYSELSSDPLLHLTLAAGATSIVALMTNITVAFARSPMLLAVQARAIQDYSRGRLLLGLGSQVKPHIERRFGMPWSSPAARMAEYIAAMHAIWHAWATGSKLDFRGDFYSHTLMTPMFTPPTQQPAPPVLVAAVGSQMTETAGAAADGLLVHSFSTERYLREVTLPALERGRRRSHGSTVKSEFEIVVSPFVVTGATAEATARCDKRVREQLAFYGSTPAYKPVLELHGWGELADELNRLSKTSGSAKWRQMGQLIDDDVLAAFAVVAEPADVGAELVRRYSDVVTRCSMSALGIDDRSVAEGIADGIRVADRAAKLVRGRPTQQGNVMR